MTNQPVLQSSFSLRNFYKVSAATKVSGGMVFFLEKLSVQKVLWELCDRKGF